MLIRNMYVCDKNSDVNFNLSVKNVYVTQDRRIEILDISADLSQKKIEREIDAQQSYTLMPGMFDAHVHGQGGPDFADVGEHPEQISIITQALGKTGLAYAMATLVSLKLEKLQASLKAIDNYVEEQEQHPTPGATKIVGIHLEGPFIAKNCKGAHDESVLQDKIDIDIFRNIIAAAPHIKHWKMTLAPDIAGALTFIKEVKKLQKEGIFVKISIGHSNPQEALLDEVFKTPEEETGERVVVGTTHLGNGCQEGCCREARKLEEKDATSHLVKWVIKNGKEAFCPNGIELIVDQVHLSKDFVELIDEHARDKVVLVTDALGPSGLEDGVYKLGTLNIIKQGNTFYLADQEGHFVIKEKTLSDGSKISEKTLAGNAAPLSFCVETYAKWVARSDFQQTMQSIYAAVIENPRTTSLSLKAVAALPDDRNFVIFSKEGQLVMSLCNGKIIEYHAGITKKYNMSITVNNPNPQIQMTTTTVETDNDNKIPLVN